jgi:hypothetical protein
MTAVMAGVAVRFCFFFSFSFSFSLSFSFSFSFSFSSATEAEEAIEEERREVEDAGWDSPPGGGGCDCKSLDTKRTMNDLLL